MGWLGAMAGAGQGLQQFSSIMGENRKLQWEQQQSDIAYQRQLNLEQLRKQNDMDVAKTQRQWKMEDYDIAQKKEEETYQRRRGEEETDYQRRRAEAVQDRKIGFQEQLDQMRAQAEIASDLAFDQKTKLLEYQNNELKKMGADERMIQMNTLSVIAPDLFKVLSTSTGKNGLSAEDAVRAASEANKMMEIAGERWDMMSDKEKEIQKRNLDIGKNEDARTVFAETAVYSQMEKSPLWKTILSGGDGGSSSVMDMLGGGSEKSSDTSTEGSGFRLRGPEFEAALKNADKFINSSEWSKLTDPSQRKAIEEAAVGGMERSSNRNDIKDSGGPSYDEFVQRMRGAYGSPIKTESKKDRDLWEVFMNSQNVQGINFASATKRDLTELWNSFISWKNTINEKNLQKMNSSGR